MTKDTEKEVVQACNENKLYDYIANNYYHMNNYELKEVLLAVLGVGYDNCRSEKDEVAYSKKIIDELGNRGWGLEENEE